MSRETCRHPDSPPSVILTRVIGCNAWGHHKKLVDIPVTEMIFGDYGRLKTMPLGATLTTPKRQNDGQCRMARNFIFFNGVEESNVVPPFANVPFCVDPGNPT